MNEGPSSFISTMTEMELTTILQALGDPIRLQIVGALADGEPRACGSFAHLGVGAPTISHHFKVLREAGLVETEMHGSKRLNTLRREAVDADFPGLLDSVLESARPMRV
jgi:DNA-binding transcriptional ArsR family regulator